MLLTQHETKASVKPTSFAPLPALSPLPSPGSPPGQHRVCMHIRSRSARRGFSLLLPPPHMFSLQFSAPPPASFLRAPPAHPGGCSALSVGCSLGPHLQPPAVAPPDGDDVAGHSPPALGPLNPRGPQQVMPCPACSSQCWWCHWWGNYWTGQ